MTLAGGAVARGAGLKTTKVVTTLPATVLTTRLGDGVGVGLGHATKQTFLTSTSRVHVFLVVTFFLQILSALPAASKNSAVLGHVTVTRAVVLQSKLCFSMKLQSFLMRHGVGFGVGVGHSLAHVRFSTTVVLQARRVVVSRKQVVCVPTR